MLALRIEGANMVMTAPEGCEDTVRPLYVWRTSEGAFVSRWEPTPDELAALNRGGSVELWCLGSQPPVALLVRPHADERPDSLGT